MRANVTGAIHDLDSEFVHDLRVATRRSRSALRLFSLVLDPEAARSLAAELSWIASLLGATRDMDVLLARLDHYFASVEAGPDFRDILGGRLRDRRANALSGLVEALQSGRFPDLLDKLESCGGADVPDPVIDNAHRVDQPARRFARARIDKAFAKLALWTERPVQSLSDVELHRIRILFKRLRYMCEFFRPLLGKDAGDLIGSFVGFQDCLGLHQDATTALHMLSGILAEVPPHLRSEEFLLCAGAILQVQRDIQREQRERFARRWKSAPGLFGIWKGLRGVLGETA
jgi:CHAD domain-containing protein